MHPVGVELAVPIPENNFRSGPHSTDGTFLYGGVHIIQGGIMLRVLSSAALGRVEVAKDQTVPAPKSSEPPVPPIVR